MPKVKPSKNTKLREFVVGGWKQHFSTDGLILFCKVCEVKVAAEKQFNVQQHCSTLKHKSSVAQNSALESRQQLLFQKKSVSSMPSKTSEFSKDLCEMMMSADIPLHKLNNQHLRKFLERYTNQHIPSETTLRKHCDCLLPRRFK
jgi:hypothetical protein